MPHTCCEQFRILLAHTRLQFLSRFPLGLMGPPHLDATDELHLITRIDLTRTTQRTGLEDAVLHAGQRLLWNLTLQISQAFSQHWVIQNVMYLARGLETVLANCYLLKSSQLPEQTKYTFGYHSFWDQVTELAQKHMELLFHLSIDLFIITRRTSVKQGRVIWLILIKL